MALVIAASGVALAVIDLEHHRLPNAIVYTTYPLALVAGVVGVALAGEWNRLLGAALGAVLWGLVIGGAWLVTRGRGMGLGDVKLAPLLGGSLGAIGVVESAAGLLIALVIGAVVGGALLAGGKVGRRQAIAFGPFMILGWFLTMVAGVVLVDGYLALVLG
jgi:leader peptidase (prepilin peptidase)/N-methyltransferase